ncbi:MAG TPA: class I SAM-dependent methyltransferase [Terriglobia bacterium]|nr:class I SAM-dependent methyltransferase [Terriglobia bacterium]
MATNLWTNREHALDYLRRADKIPHRTEGEAMLLDLIPAGITRFLDLGSGNGRLLMLVRAEHPAANAVAVDFSPAMLEALRGKFAGDPSTVIIEHNLENRLPELGKFDAVVSSFAIHHLPDARKRTLYEEVYGLLASGGIFYNLEHVSSPTPELHEVFLHHLEVRRNEEDPSNILLDVETQLQWLREIGFVNVDCHWKWLELALIGGQKRQGGLSA